MGVPTEKIGDSTGLFHDLSELSAHGSVDPGRGDSVQMQPGTQWRVRSQLTSGRRYRRAPRGWDDVLATPSRLRSCDYCLDYAQRSEARANLFGKQLRLFPGRKVAAFLHLVVMNQFGIRPLCPTLRRWTDLVGEDAHGNRDGDAFDARNTGACFPSRDAPRKCAVFVNQAIVMLSRTSSRVRPAASPAKTREISA